MTSYLTIEGRAQAEIEEKEESFYCSALPC